MYGSNQFIIHESYKIKRGIFYLREKTYKRWLRNWFKSKLSIESKALKRPEDQGNECMETGDIKYKKNP